MELLIIAGLVLAGLMAFSIGANDMANIIAVLVGGGVASYRVAVILFAVSVLMGSLLQGYMVMKTLGKGVVRNLDLYGAVSAILVAIIWILLATRLGLPVSTSQSITSGVLGSGLAMVLKTGNFEEVNFSVVYKIITSWIISPLLALLVAALIYLLLERVSLNENTARALAIAFAFWDGYSFGANDVANATGVYIALAGVMPTILGLRWNIFLALYGALFIIIGGVFMGRKVVETVGYRITRLDVRGSIASSATSSSSVWLFTTIPYMLFGYGLPVSTTYISVGAVMGVGIAKYRSIRRGLNPKVVLTVVLSWALTLPVCALLSMCLYYILSPA